jgi:hypothetical protein
MTFSCPALVLKPPFCISNTLEQKQTLIRVCFLAFVFHFPLRFRCYLNLRIKISTEANPLESLKQLQLSVPQNNPAR